MGTGTGKKFYPLPMSRRAWVRSTHPEPAPMPTLRGEGGAAGIIDRGSVQAEVAGAGRSYDGARGASVGACGSFFISCDRSVGTCEVRRGIAGNDGRPSDASDFHLVALLNF
jgi:hypothetical protein